ncbi:MAG: purine-binding chemotaxis protein CheW [Deltaproteobacteria bacterium]|nr:purine-binding chemotaxis protein CheW [Deltaproteobacteria bacterium]
MKEICEYEGSPRQGARSEDSKYLTFKLADEDYGIGLLKVREIIGMMPITKVPKTPLFMKGVINLRGKVIPIVDLRLKFDLTASEHDDRTCIIVVEISGPAGSIQMGLIVDRVSEVLGIKSDDVEPPPSFGTSVDTTYIKGMAKSNSSVKILLDIDRVMSNGDLAVVRSATS